MFHRRSSRLGLFGASVIAALALATVAGATTWVKLTAQQATRQSAAIVSGRITGVSVESHDVDWAETPMIYTRYVLTIEDGFKGTTPGQETLAFVSIGGELDGQAIHIPGAAHFKSGDRVFGFFFRNELDLLQPLWGGINKIVETRQGAVVIGQPDHTVDRNIRLDALRDETNELLRRR